MPSRNVVRTDAGISGYVGKRLQYRYKKRRGHNRRLRKALSFRRNVEKAMDDTIAEQQNMLITGTLRVESAANGQGYGQVCTQNSYSDLNAIFSQIGTSVQGMPALTGKAMKFTVNNYVMNLIMKNQVPASCIIDLYMCVPRFDTSMGMTTAYSSGFTDQNSSSTDIAWGSTPYMNNLFCSQFRILRKTRYLLAPGATEIVEIRDRRRRVIDNERIQTKSGSGVSQYKGISTSWFAIVRGEPVNDSSTKTNLGTVVSAVDFIVSETYFYSYTPNNMVQTLFTNGLTAVTTPNSVLIDTGASVNPTKQ